MVIEGPPTAYDRENDLYKLVSEGNIDRARALTNSLRKWWMCEERWGEQWRDAAQRVSWLNGFTHALAAIDHSRRHRALYEDLKLKHSKLKHKRKTSGGSGKRNQP